jgi:ferrous iron transport protein A
LFGKGWKAGEKTEGKAGIPALDLTGLCDGASGRIIRLLGGRDTVGKLEAMGIGPGTVIEKKSSALRRGPIVIEWGGTQVALGYGIAKGILVEPVAFSAP